MKEERGALMGRSCTRELELGGISLGEILLVVVLGNALAKSSLLACTILERTLCVA